LGSHLIIVAVPFAAGTWALGERKWSRAGAAMLVVWLWCVALREGWALILPSTVAWLACLFTVAAFGFGEQAIPFTRLKYSLKALVLEPGSRSV
jgi:hypothetical protein